jgi:hypothetical protein
MNKDLVIVEEVGALYSPTTKSQVKSRECPIFISSEEVDGKTKTKITDKNNNPVTDAKQILFDLTGTQNNDLAREIIGHGATALHAFGKEIGALVDLRYNLSMQVLAEAQPQDAIEARLVTQVNALYSQGMNYLGGLNDPKDLQVAQFHLNCASKLLRLHNETIEALSKYRRKGESKMIVQHMTLNDNAKAVISGALVQSEN